MTRPAKQFEAEIDAAHPLKTKRHDLYGKAVELVSQRHDKYDLVNLVNWLLAENDKLETKLNAVKEST